MRYFLILTLFLTSIFASDFCIDEKELKYCKALNLAESENKRLIVMVTTKSCPWCVKMKHSVLTLSDIKEALNKFIFIEIDKSSDLYPEELYPRFVPTFYMIEPKNPTSQQLINERFGYQSRSQFLKFLKDE